MLQNPKISSSQKLHSRCATCQEVCFANDQRRPFRMATATGMLHQQPATPAWMLPSKYRLRPSSAKSVGWCQYTVSYQAAFRWHWAECRGAPVDALKFCPGEQNTLETITFVKNHLLFYINQEERHKIAIYWLKTARKCNCGNSGNSTKIFQNPLKIHAKQTRSLKRDWFKEEWSSSFTYIPCRRSIADSSYFYCTDTA